MEEEPEELEPHEEEVEEEALSIEEEAPAPLPEEEPLVSPEAIPITLKVELGQLEMSAEKLLSLTPGNLLELPVAPGQPVTLTVNQRRVGKGELMMMGDQLGIRILELGR